MQLHLPDWWQTNSALTFARPWLLLLLLAIPLIAYLRGKRGPAAALTFSSTMTLRAIGKQSQARVGKILRTLLLVTLAIFVIALARPQLGKSLTQVEASGIDIMLVLDVSGSMLTKDFTIGGDLATRVDAIREVTRKFIEGRPNDRIGIIAFAGRPYVVSPMTLDHDWLTAKSGPRPDRPGRGWDRYWIGHGGGGESVERQTFEKPRHRAFDRRRKQRRKNSAEHGGRGGQGAEDSFLCHWCRHQRIGPGPDLHATRTPDRRIGKHSFIKISGCNSMRPA